MPDGRRSSSSHKAALLILTSVLGMAGCTAGAGLLASRDGPGELRLVTLGSSPEITASTSAITGAPTKPDVVQIRPVTFETNDELEIRRGASISKRIYLPKPQFFARLR